VGGAIARAGMLVGLAQARRRIFATLPSGLHIPPAVQRSVGVRPVRWRVSPAAGGSAGQVRAGAPAVRRAHSLAGHMGDGDYAPDDDSDVRDPLIQPLSFGSYTGARFAHTKHLLPSLSPSVRNALGLGTLTSAVGAADEPC
jgi:hypothetical protein